MLEGWSGASPIIQGIVIASARQSILQLLPTTGWRVGPGALEAGLRVPLAGRNLPAGPALSLGYFLRVPGR